MLFIVLNVLSYKQETSGFFVDSKTSIVGSLYPFFKSFSDFGPEALRDLIGPAANSALYSSLFVAAVFILLVISSSLIYYSLKYFGVLDIATTTEEPVEVHEEYYVENPVEHEGQVIENNYEEEEEH
jgi:hypothetical protein